MKKPKIQKIHNVDKVTSIKKIIRTNLHFVGILFLLCIALYANTINNELTLIDDVQGFTYDTRIQSISESMTTGSVQKVLYAISYKYFALNPVPLRIFSVFLHYIATVLVFIFLFLLVGKTEAIIGTLVFLTHPINTEAVTWFSGSPYLYIAIFDLLIFILFLKYKQNTLNKKYIYLAVFFYILEIALNKSPWVIIVPAALLVIDQLFLSKKFEFSNMTWLVILAIPLSIYLAADFSRMYSARMEYRAGSGNRITMNTQSFKPIFEGYPYTTYLMSTLYVFPLNLSVYYDGMPVTTGLYISMYVVFFGYVWAVFYFLNKKREIAGVLIMLPLLIAPTYSPVKVTWFLAERYMYLGSAFFGLLIAWLFAEVTKLVSRKEYAYIAFGVLISLYSFRTILRNGDWQNTLTISEANMKSSPLSVRPYNDTGGHYYLQGDLSKAMEMYEKGLTIVPNSGTAINNLGLIYLEQGPLVLRSDFKVPVQDRELSDKYFKNALTLFENKGDLRTISYFLNKSLAYDIASVDKMMNIADFYFNLKMTNYARRMYEHILDTEPTNEPALQRISILGIDQN